MIIDPKLATLFYVFAAPFTKVSATRNTKIIFDVDGVQVIPKTSEYRIKEDEWNIHLTKPPTIIGVEPPPSSVISNQFSLGEMVNKSGGDYSFQGYVVAVFNKLGGARRYVVENQYGDCHIFQESHLTRVKTDAQ